MTAASPSPDTPLGSSEAFQDPQTVRLLPRRTGILVALLIPAILLTVVLVVAETRAPWRSTVARDAIPLQLGKWTALEGKLSDQELDILETRDYVMRAYNDDLGPAVNLCVVFSQDNRKGTHPPDVCLEGAGSRIISKNDRLLEVAPGFTIGVRELVTVFGSTPIYYTYFYKCGDAFTPSFYRQQVQIIWNGLTRHNAAGALIRYSTQMRSLDDVAGARERTDELIRATFPSIRDRLNTPGTSAPPTESASGS